ncbi:hypothetical protein A6C57_26180 [Fibrella sp. ES10-3-2-2]
MTPLNLDTACTLLASTLIMFCIAACICSWVAYSVTKSVARTINKVAK